MTDTRPPLVSVLVPAYKRADTIVAAVRSALDQTWTNLEVVVVDDHSEDGTERALAEIDDDRVTLLTHETNRGGNAARRTAIEASRGEFLAFLDADDLWLPTKVEKQVAALEAGGPTAGLSYTWYDLRYPDGRLEAGRRPTASGVRALELLQANVIGTFSCVMVRREVVDTVGTPDPGLPSCQDWEFYLRVNEEWSIECVPEVLVHYWRDDSDVHRISASAAKVSAGHREVYARIVDRLSTLPPSEATAGHRYFLEIFGNHADVGGVARVMTHLPVRHLTAADVRFAAHMAVRAARKSAAAAHARRRAGR
ncbi:glycosyltransferase family 2 protein [Mobilicoccus pelagius]|uniref:Putative glycosyltransferase n=1 Tax=Mobilicoccus pelagius NBRC 104925 TaxID=1089455 RepID=H5UMQ8_9MICO|nr:glycosyltransferase family 2 protein [Mobilicoccus pelagius]GAB47016.1 putative glycosyltransferase [Mobilicoccus pelagius NBRC 104925]